MTLTIHLRDRNAALVEAWRRNFSAFPDVKPTQGDIFGVSADAIVSPANSFGYMDGGIDAVYTERFGGGVQARLQSVLRDEHHGELPVGQAVIVETSNSEIPWLVAAPTMRIPGPVPRTVNAYLAFRAALRAVADHNRRNPNKTIASILCPGLATAIGAMPEDRCARQMLLAYEIVVQGRRWPSLSPREILSLHGELIA